MNNGKDNNYLFKAIEACDKLGNLPEDRSVDRISLIGEIGEALGKMDEHDQDDDLMREIEEALDQDDGLMREIGEALGKMNEYDQDDNREQQNKTFEEMYKNSLERLRSSFPDIPEDLTGKNILIKDSLNDVVIDISDRAMYHTKKGEVRAIASRNGEWRGYLAYRDRDGSRGINPNYFYEGICEVADHPENYNILIRKALI